jgi:hypothetical protein
MDVVSLSRALYKALRAREEELAYALSSGVAANWEQYQSMVGEIRGLAFAREELKALLEKRFEDGEETLSS